MSSIKTEGIISITESLFKMQDLGYKAFSGKLVPNIDGDRIIGVRMPDIKKYAKALYGKREAEKFLSDLPHSYLEENNLHGFLIGQIKDFDKCIEELERFLPYVDNWATCDSLRLGCFKKNTTRLLPYVENWLTSGHTYTVRFAIETLMLYFLDSEFDVGFLEKVSMIRTDEYYINMMIAWYFATALSKQWKSAVKYIEQYKLPVWVHNKTIQKAVESYRLTDEQKAYLKGFRKKG